MAESTDARDLASVVDGAIGRLLSRLSGSPDRDWVIRELVAEIAHRDQELKDLELKCKRYTVACAYMVRRGNLPDGVLKESRRIASTMVPQDVEDRYRSHMEAMERKRQKRNTSP